MRGKVPKKGIFGIFVVSLVLELMPMVRGNYKPHGQDPEQSERPIVTPKNKQPTRVIHSGDDDYRLGLGDVIKVQIVKAPELSGTFRVGADGSFQMPYLGRLAARNKTPEELSRLISDGLRDRYLRNPLVVVDIVEYNSRTFFIQGAVRSSGIYQIDGKVTLLQLINVAGGLAENHGATAFIIRPIKVQNSNRDVRPNPVPPDSNDQIASGQEAKYELLRANIIGLYKGSFDQDLVIEPGDIVNIPKTEIFFVAGEVRRPGSFQQIEGTTLRQAISMAQGTTFRAATKRAMIFRENPQTGKHEEIHVDVGAVMKGTKEDVAILANDIIVIPNSRSKSISTFLLSGLGMGFSNVIRMPTTTY